MRYLCMVVGLLVALAAPAQRQKPVSLRFTGQFDFGVRGMGLNDAAMGVGTGVSLRAKRGVQALVEARSHWYIGDKLLELDNEGRALPNGSLHTVQAGPQVFLTKTLALSATYGVAWHRYKSWDYTANEAYCLALTGYFGDGNTFVTQLSWMQAPGTGVRQFGIGVGYRLL